MARVMLAATGSGCGKTTIVCAILQAFCNRGLQLAALKCGPDYIDPMFHRAVMGVMSGNLDSFFMEPALLRAALWDREKCSDLCVLEGAMGFYDGIASSTDASAWQIAVWTDTPVILIVNCRGMGCHSIAAVVRGFCSQEAHSQIKGVIFNQLSARLYEDVCEVISDLSVQPLGYFPRNEAFHISSRHLGLLTAMEVTEMQEKLQLLAQHAVQSLDLDGIFTLAQQAPCCAGQWPALQPAVSRPVTIAVTQDAAFCFLYEENLRLMEQLGAQLAFFSPLQDSCLPQGTQGLYLCGGYPELYGAVLSANHSLLAEIRLQLTQGMPVIAECGGFLYLHQTLQDAAGNDWPLVGYLQGKAWPTDKLQRFGYVTLTAQRENLAEQAQVQLRGHEFHYWESDCCGVDFIAQKAGRSRSWLCGHSSAVLYAGFPHLFFFSNPAFVKGFLRKAAVYHGNTEMDTTDPARFVDA